MTDTGGEQTRAWRPAVAGIREVFHARFVDHAYPAHTHDAWTLLIVDDGAIRFDLDRQHHGAVGATVTLLPPDVPHDGRAASAHGFRKRVLYLDSSVLGAELAGAAVDAPSLDDALLRHRIHQLHRSLTDPGDAFEAESRLALIRERLHRHLLVRVREAVPRISSPPPRQLAGQLRDLLDANAGGGLSLRDASQRLHVHPAHLVRSFTAAFGLPPHLYLTGRRIDIARQLLLAGQRPAEVASAAGFYDQAHLTRQFKRYLGTTPARFAAPAHARTVRRDANILPAPR